jgi:hypothetical protein
VHRPDLDDDEDATPDADAASPRRSTGQVAHRSKSLLKIVLEVLLISGGVFLGLMGEQWREHTQHRELAEASLRR